MTVTTLNGQFGRIWPQFADGNSHATPLWSDGATSGFTASSTDLTTLLEPHLLLIRGTRNPDQGTAWAQDIPIVWAAQNDANHDLNANYWVWLQTNQ